MKYLTAMLFFGLMIGCATSEKVIMFKPGTDETKVCGPYTTGGNIPTAAMISNQKLRQCVSDYQRQGYERQ